MDRQYPPISATRTRSTNQRSHVLILALEAIEHHCSNIAGGDAKHPVLVTVGNCLCELMERCDKDIRNYFVLEKRALPHQHSGLRPRGLTTMLRVPIHLATC